MGHCRVHVVAPRFRAFTAARCTAGSRSQGAHSLAHARLRHSIATELWAAGSCGVNASSSRLQPVAASSSWRPSSLPLAIRLRTPWCVRASRMRAASCAVFASPSTLLVAHCHPVLVCSRSRVGTSLRATSPRRASRGFRSAEGSPFFRQLVGSIIPLVATVGFDVLPLDVDTLLCRDERQFFSDGSNCGAGVVRWCAHPPSSASR
eukprot:2612197-Prymnesium_polylepis.2